VGGGGNAKGDQGPELEGRSGAPILTFFGKDSWLQRLAVQCERRDRGKIASC